MNVKFVISAFMYSVGKPLLFSIIYSSVGHCNGYRLYYVT